MLTLSQMLSSSSMSCDVIIRPGSFSCIRFNIIVSILVPTIIGVLRLSRAADLINDQITLFVYGSKPVLGSSKIISFVCEETIDIAIATRRYIPPDR